jgi:ubiquinone/menaquinone biosynthesis C-methylase UbiE/AcrR family transcriptional regulator
MTRTVAMSMGPRRSTMSRLEKRLVNSERKSRAVGRRLRELLSLAGPVPGSRHLDVGCGNGAATIAVASAYRLDATGVDLDPGQIALARAAAGDGPVRFLEADATHLPFPDSGFDVVTSSKATHHIPTWLGALAEMARVLRPGGHLVYSDLVVPRPVAWLAGRLTGHAPPTRRALDRAVEGLGLETVHRRVAPALYEAVLRKPGRPSSRLAPVPSLLLTNHYLGATVASMPPDRMTAAERREAILDAAVEEIAARGYEGATTAAVAERAGISQPYIFRFFATKKELYIAALDRCTERLLRGWEETATRAGETRLEALARAFIEALPERRNELKVKFSAYSDTDDPEIAEVLRHHLARIYRYIVHEAERDGIPDPQAAAAAFVSRGYLINAAVSVGLDRALTPGEWDAITRVRPREPART